MSSFLLVSSTTAEEPRLWLSYPGGDPAVSLGTTQGGWPKLAERVRRQAKWYEANYNWQVGLWLQNPWGHGWGAMQYDQRRRLAAMNTDGRFDAVLDMGAMQEALSGLVRDGIPVCVYIGGPEQMPLAEGESVDDWLQRTLSEIQPILAINPPVWLGFDSTAGEPSRFPTGDRQEAFIRGVSSAHQGPLLVEPGYVNEWMSDLGVGIAASEDFFRKNIETGNRHWYARANPRLRLNWNWQKPSEVRGPIALRFTGPASLKPYNAKLKKDDPAKAAAIAEWVDGIMQEGYHPIANTPFLPGYADSVRP